MEKSCGIIIYNQEQKFLLITQNNGDVGFPKGHVEIGETEEETALREVKEETGIEVILVDGFKENISYIMPNGVSKEVIYFLGKGVNSNIKIQIEEVKKADFYCYKDALNILTFESAKKLLIKADKFIKNLNK